MKIGATLILGLTVWGTLPADAANLLLNGNLDLTYGELVSPGVTVPKPLNWVNNGSLALTGATEGELSSEPWAGPSPTPVTTDGTGLPYATGDGCDGLDCAVFFKAFIGTLATGDLASGHLYQDVAAVAGLTYTLSGWAGAEANFLADEAVFRLLFFDAGDAFLGGGTLDLFAAGLLTPNGQPFNYKEYSLSMVAPANTAKVRALISFIDGYANPQGGGQAFVVDDFTLDDGTGGEVPEPATGLLMGAGLAAVAWARRRTQRRASIR
ncbi:MAG: PEP-CTERM sorting domain-containing protein [Acidobacteriota bacterium]